MLTVPVPLPEGVQITSYTSNFPSPDPPSVEKTDSFAGKLEQAMSGKVEDENRTGPAGNGDKAVKADGAEKKAPESGKKNSGKEAVEQANDGTKAAKDADTKAGAGEGAGQGADKGASKSVAKGAGQGAGEGAGQAPIKLAGNGAGAEADLRAASDGVSPSNHADLQQSHTLATGEGIEEGSAASLSQNTEPEISETADQKSTFSEEGNTPQIAVPLQNTDSGAQAKVLPFASEPQGGLKKGGLERTAAVEESGKTVIEVRDYRTSRTAATSEEGGLSETVKGEIAEEVSLEAEKESSDVPIRLVRSSFGGDRGSDPSAVRTARNEGFAAYVKENLSNQIVKQSGIILRNNNRGEIRLVLKPEHLGRVRLRIQLDENRLSGRIFVDSSFVKDSFEQNLEALYRAFRNSGFEASGFEVFVDGRGAGEGTPGDRETLNAKTLKQLDDAVPILEEIDQNSELINLVI